MSRWRGVYGENYKTEAESHDMKKPLTNADCIRSLTDKELAEIFASDFTSEKIPFCKNTPECDKILDSGEIIPESMCVDCALDWLKKEVKHK